MKWALCVSTGANELKVYAFCDTGYPRTDENGWYHAFMDGGDTIFVQKKFVAFMYPLREGRRMNEEWQKAFCIPERRRMVDIDGWFSVTAVLRRRGRCSVPAGERFRLGVFHGKADHARSVYFAICNLVDRGDIPGCYVYADACSVEDKAPCLMDSTIGAAYEDE